MLTAFKLKEGKRNSKRTAKANVFLDYLNNFIANYFSGTSNIDIEKDGMVNLFWLVN